MNFTLYISWSFSLSFYFFPHWTSWIIVINQGFFLPDQSISYSKISYTKEYFICSLKNVCLLGIGHARHVLNSRTGEATAGVSLSLSKTCDKYFQDWITEWELSQKEINNSLRKIFQKWDPFTKSLLRYCML